MNADEGTDQDPPLVFCTACGARIPEGRRSCPECGAPLEVPLPRRGGTAHRLMSRRELPGELKVAAGCSGCMGLISLIALLILAPMVYQVWTMSARGIPAEHLVITFAAGVHVFTVAVMVLLFFGFARGRRWAWWIAVFFFGLHVLQAVGMAVYGMVGSVEGLAIAALIYAGMFGVVFWLVLRAQRGYEKYCDAKQGTTWSKGS